MSILIVSAFLYGNILIAGKFFQPFKAVLYPVADAGTENRIFSMNLSSNRKTVQGITVDMSFVVNILFLKSIHQLCCVGDGNNPVVAG